MYNGDCVEPDGSMLPAIMTIKEDDLLGTVIRIEDYHGNINTFVTSRKELERLLKSQKQNV